MDEDFKKRINERMQSIPKQYREVIEAFGWEKILEDIGKENNLLLTEIEDLYVETFLVMLGLTNPDDFVYEIEDRLVVERDEAEKIASEVDQRLLTPLRETLLKKFPDMNISTEDTVEDEQTIQNSISNPPTSKPISFVEQKLGAPHSVSGNSAPIPIPPGEKYADPYREQF